MLSFVLDPNRPRPETTTSIGLSHRQPNVTKVRFAVSEHGKNARRPHPPIPRLGHRTGALELFVSNVQ